MRKTNVQSGFTLIEVLIGFSIITIVAAATYMAQSTSIFNSSKTESIAIATNLARNFLEQEELELEKAAFPETSVEETGQFEEPYRNFYWKKEVLEIDFSSLPEILASISQEATNVDSISEAQQKVFSIFAIYLKDSIRKLVVTISWGETEEDREKEENKLRIITYLVKYDAKIQANL